MPGTLPDFADLLAGRVRAPGVVLFGCAKTGLTVDAPIQLLEPNQRELSIPAIISTPVPDRSEDVVEPMGIDITDYRINPVVMLEHGKHYHLPVGMSWAYRGAPCTVRAYPDRVEATAFHSEKDQMSYQTFCLLHDGLLSATSVNFDAIPGFCKKRTSHMNRTGRPGMHVVKWKLIEWSWTPIGDNPQTVRKLLDYGCIGEDRLCLHIIKSLEPYADAIPIQGKGFTLELPTPVVTLKKADPFAMHDFSKAYNPDEARDDHGKWSGHSDEDYAPPRKVGRVAEDRAEVTRPKVNSELYPNGAVHQNDDQGMSSATYDNSGKFIHSGTPAKTKAELKERMGRRQKEVDEGNKQQAATTQRLEAQRAERSKHVETSMQRLRMDESDMDKWDDSVPLRKDPSPVYASLDDLRSHATSLYQQGLKAGGASGAVKDDTKLAKVHAAVAGKLGIPSLQLRDGGYPDKRGVRSNSVVMHPDKIREALGHAYDHGVTDAWPEVKAGLLGKNKIPKTTAEHVLADQDAIDAPYRAWADKHVNKKKAFDPFASNDFSIIHQPEPKSMGTKAGNKPDDDEDDDEGKPKGKNTKPGDGKKPNPNDTEVADDDDDNNNNGNSNGGGSNNSNNGNNNGGNGDGNGGNNNDGAADGTTQAVQNAGNNNGGNNVPYGREASKSVHGGLQAMCDGIEGHLQKCEQPQMNKHLSDLHATLKGHMAELKKAHDGIYPNARGELKDDEGMDDGGGDGGSMAKSLGQARLMQLSKNGATQLAGIADELDVLAKVDNLAPSQVAFVKSITQKIGHVAETHFVKAVGMPATETTPAGNPNAEAIKALSAQLGPLAERLGKLNERAAEVIPSKPRR